VLKTKVKGNNIVVFGQRLRQQQDIQLCDLMDEKLFKFVQELKRYSTCQKEGWFHIGLFGDILIYIYIYMYI
jgi:hypothetical protein